MTTPLTDERLALLDDAFDAIRTRHITEHSVSWRPAAGFAVAFEQASLDRQALLAEVDRLRAALATATASEQHAIATLNVLLPHDRRRESMFEVLEAVMVYAEERAEARGELAAKVERLKSALGTAEEHIAADQRKLAELRAALATATEERLALAKVVAYPVTDHYGVMHAKERGIARRIVATKEGGERG